MFFSNLFASKTLTICRCAGSGSNNYAYIVLASLNFDTPIFKKGKFILAGHDEVFSRYSLNTFNFSSKIFSHFPDSWLNVFFIIIDRINCSLSCETNVVINCNLSRVKVGSVASISWFHWFSLIHWNIELLHSAEIIDATCFF